MSLCHEDVSLACLISFSFFLFCKMFNIATSALIPCQVYVHDKFYCKSTVYTLFFHFPFALVLWISNLTNPLSVLLNIHAGKDITIYKKWDLSIDIRMILLFKKSTCTLLYGYCSSEPSLTNFRLENAEYWEKKKIC